VILSIPFSIEVVVTWPREGLYISIYPDSADCINDTNQSQEEKLGAKQAERKIA
jgi:hypothetical protein